MASTYQGQPSGPTWKYLPLNLTRQPFRPLIAGNIQPQIRSPFAPAGRSLAGVSGVFRASPSFPYPHTTMALRLLVNSGLLAIPIGGTVGALMGIDAHRAATGQAPLFSGDKNSTTGPGDSTGGGSGGSGSTTNNGVTTTKYCELSYGISPPTTGQQFTCKSSDRFSSYPLPNIGSSRP